jgi:hypothetical protein
MVSGPADYEHAFRAIDEDVRDAHDPWGILASTTVAREIGKAEMA